MEAEVGRCGVCSVTVTEREAHMCDCQRVSYCSREHLEDDWRNHKERDCFPAVITGKKNGSGFKVTATRKLLEGQKIIREKPMILVPYLQHHKAPCDMMVSGGGGGSSKTILCLGCCRTIPPQSSTTNDYHSCSSCKWHICSLECEQKNFHKNYECKVFSEKKVEPENVVGTIEPTQLYWNIAILRCYLAMERDPDNWKNMFTIQESLEVLTERIGSKSNRQIYLVAHKFIGETCGFLQFSLEQCERIFKILWVSSFEPSEILFKEKISHMRMVYKYAWAFIPSSCCVPNARWAVTDPNDPEEEEEEEPHFVVRSSMHINKDENIFVDVYGLEPLFNNPTGTFLRRAVLEKRYLRPCSCSRCLDPTEWETFLMAVKCRKEKCDGYLLPSKPVGTEEQQLKWKCLECKSCLKHDVILYFIETMTSRLSEAKNCNIAGSKQKGTVAQIKAILDAVKYCEENLVHKNHFLLLSAILFACELFLAMFMSLFKRGQQGMMMKDCESLKISLNLIPLVKRLYKITNVLYPGKSQLRGVAVSSSVFTITAMSIDRYLAIRHPMSRKIINRRTTRKVILVLWTIALLIFAPILYIRKFDVTRIALQDESHDFPYCVEAWPNSVYRRTFGIFCFIVVYAIPGCVVIVAYSLMGLRLCSRQLLPEYQLTHGASSSNSRNDLAHCDSANSAWQVSSAGGRLIRERRRVAKILLVLALVFAFCWMPYSVLSLILDLKSPSPEDQSKGQRKGGDGSASSYDNDIASTATLLLPFAILLGHANSAVNPLLYCLLSKNFRRSVTELIRHPRRAVRGRQQCKIRMTFRRDPPQSAEAMSSNNKPEQVNSRPRNPHTPEPTKAASNPFVDVEPAEICIVDLGNNNPAAAMVAYSPSSSGYSSLRQSTDTLAMTIVSKESSLGHAHICSHSNPHSSYYPSSSNGGLCLSSLANGGTKSLCSAPIVGPLTQTSTSQAVVAILAKRCGANDGRKVHVPSTIREESDSCHSQKSRSNVSLRAYIPI